MPAPDLDFLFTGRVWTGLAGGAAVDAVAVRGGHIVATGRAVELAADVGKRTRVVPVTDGLLLPAFQDAHAHPLWGGLAAMACDLSGSEHPEDWLHTLVSYAAEHPDRAVIHGEGWTPYPFPGGLPHRELLDRVVPERPVVLVSRDGHSTWANSAALRAVGIGRDHPDPPAGIIVRDERGEPVGVFHEAAKGLVEQLIPEPGPEELAAGLLGGQAYLHRLGIAAWLDAIVEPAHEATYLGVARKGGLTGRAALALRWDPERGIEQLEGLVSRRAAIEAAGLDRVKAVAVKLFADGVIESSTAALLRPYEDGSGVGAAGRGATIHDADELREICIALDAAGFAIHAHAIGDRAVRETLDAIEAARRINGIRDARHAIAHLELVDAADIPRFAELDVIADCQPLWAVHDDSDEVLLPRLGQQRLEQRYPFGRLRDAGAAIAFGSDWNVSTADPLRIMAVATTRLPPGARAGSPLGPPDDRLSAEEALRAYTSGSARVHRLETETGTIEVGKAADLVLLEGDPLAPGMDLMDCRVRLTMVAGRIVHES